VRARVLIGLALAAAATWAVGADVAAAPQPPTGGDLYLVRPDLRRCASPLCGGSWVRRVNRASTRCGDGARRRECYVASLSGAELPDGAGLARGRIVPARIPSFPELDRLDAAASWRATPGGKDGGIVYRVRDNGVRCITHPCFSLTAGVAESTRRQTLSSLDLRTAGALPALERRARAAVARTGLYAAGTIRVVPDEGPAGDGRTLVVSRFWLPS
jgi:hypothetical protein